MSDSGLKVPSQVFRWFEKMKANYENSVQATLKHFENYSNQQQDRLDKSHQETITNLKENHAAHLAQSNQVIDDLKQDINYYKQQIAQQQLAIEKLNNRYDKAMDCLLNNTSQPQNIKEIYNAEDKIQADHIFISDNSVSIVEVPENEYASQTETSEITEESTPNLIDEELYLQGLSERKSGDFDAAIQHFNHAAELGCAKSMGALARAYFTAEGVEEDQLVGLCWLIKAAISGLPQAINKLDSYKLEQPELYDQASCLLNDSPRNEISEQNKMNIV